MSSIEISEILPLAGMSNDRNVDQEELARFLLPASIEAFADGEILTVHEPIVDRELRTYYGERYFHDGIVAPTLREAAIVNGMAAGSLTDYQRFAAQYYLKSLSKMITPQEIKSGVSIVDDTVEFDGNRIRLSRSLERLIDYGPGIAGLSHTKAQVEMVKKRITPYSYLTISRFPFTNAVLMYSYDELFEPGATDQFVRNQFYLGREDGIQSATNEMVAVETEATGTAEVADVILASGLSRADKDSIKTGIGNAFKLLREGGALVIRSVAQPAIDEVGSLQMIEWAHEAGFQEDKTECFDVVTGGLGLAVVGKSHNRKSISAVLTK